MRTVYKVHQEAKHVATFREPSTAFWFASVYGARVAPLVYFEVSDRTGLVGQFIGGHPTPEFSHLAETVTTDAAEIAETETDTTERDRAIDDRMKAAGFGHMDTGGGCVGWATDWEGGSKPYALLCTNDQDKYGDPDAEIWLVGSNDSEGGYVQYDRAFTLARAVEVAASTPAPSPLGEQVTLPLCIGDRVRFIRDCGDYPLTPVPAGSLGTVTGFSLEDDGFRRWEVKLDQHFPDLDEWDNVLWVHCPQSDLTVQDTMNETAAYYLELIPAATDAAK